MADAWTWSPAHNDYYLYTYENGTPVYHWAKQQQPQQLQQPALSEPSRSVPRHDSPILPSTLLSSPDPSYPEGAGLYYTTTEQGYSSRPSNTPHTTHQSYPSAPNYPSGGGAYPANSSLPTTQAAESQPHAHHQGYYLTQSTRPSLGNVNDAYPPQPESATAGGPLEELPALAIRGTPGETEKLDPGNDSQSANPKQ
ncbi:hypothetical protein AOQ84DRAFT_68472 [Glonium stellatum]|uniref:Uncharacterized protein n=1 Tax=Glonium stellatum TaxID=574774 RepID=A0A8E2EYA7_9PEZI|nr:hypothetical protein AOQ84DRAFT_68472 [Glonium stellatum]